LCFGYLLEQGFGIDGREQVLIHGGGETNEHSTSTAKESMAVLGQIRVLQAPFVEGLQVVRMVRAEVEHSLINSASLAFPALQGPVPHHHSQGR
jgi:acetylglutamate kinase